MLLVRRYCCSANVLKLQFMEIGVMIIMSIMLSQESCLSENRPHKTLLTFIALNINVDDDDVLN